MIKGLFRDSARILMTNCQVIGLPCAQEAVVWLLPQGIAELVPIVPGMRHRTPARSYMQLSGHVGTSSYTRFRGSGIESGFLLHITPMYYSSFHFLFQYPYINPTYYSSFRSLFHCPSINPIYFMQLRSRKRSFAGPRVACARWQRLRRCHILQVLGQHRRLYKSCVLPPLGNSWIITIIQKYSP